MKQTIFCVSCNISPSVGGSFHTKREIFIIIIFNFVLGDGNFAVVRVCKDKNSNKEYALKVIDKAKCKGKEHYVEAEV